MGKKTNIHSTNYLPFSTIKQNINPLKHRLIFEPPNMTNTLN